MIGLSPEQKREAAKQEDNLIAEYNEEEMKKFKEAASFCEVGDIFDFLGCKAVITQKHISRWDGASGSCVLAMIATQNGIETHNFYLYALPMLKKVMGK